MSQTPKIYTKGGDEGRTSLLGGTRVLKSEDRLEAYGTVDELNSVLGLASSTIEDSWRGAQLAEKKKAVLGTIERVQNELFVLGSLFACEKLNVLSKLPRLPQAAINTQEKEIDQWTSEMPPLKNFILPGGSPGSAQLHLARTICRRAERVCVRYKSQLPAAEEETWVEGIRYLNRLSDWLFTLARYSDHLLDRAERIWKPTK